MTREHVWWTWVPIPTEIIRNEDDVFSFRFRFDSGLGNDLDKVIVGHFSPESTGCSNCQEYLEDAFGEPCSNE